MFTHIAQGAKAIPIAAAFVLVLLASACEKKKDAPPPAPELRQGGQIAAAERAPAGNQFLGDRLPDFTLQTPAGETLRLADLMDGEHYVAVIFHSPLCPCAENCARAISSKLSSTDYPELTIVGVVSDAAMDAAWFREDLEKQIADRVVTFPVVLDPDRSVLRAYGARRTPTVWLADKQGIIRYWGAPENTLEPTESRYHFLLKEAVDALRRGEQPEVTSFDPIGCLIEMED